MNSDIKDQKEINSDKINLNHFYNLMANSLETNKLIELLKKYIQEYYSFNNSQYIKLNELYSKFSSEKMRKNFIKTSIYELEYILNHIIEKQLNLYKSISSKIEIFNSIITELSELQKIIGKFSLNLNFSNNLNINPEINSIINEMKRLMNDFENKIVEKFILEKYNKHIINTCNKNIDELVYDIKQHEKNMDEYIKKENSRFYSQIKEPNDKIQCIYNNIKNHFNEYLIFIKEKLKIFFNELDILENEINTKKNNIESKSDENFIYLQSDFELNEDDLYNVKYQIKIIKHKEIDIEEENNISLKESDQHKKKFIENNLFLDEKDTYEIISNIYKYDFKILDKSNYNLDIEKEKLIALDLSKQIIEYSKDDEITKNKLNEKYNELIESINSKILNNIENIETFFFCLNNHRVNGNTKFNDKFYDIIIHIYKITQDKLLKNDYKKLHNLMIILSQTYYKEINKKKIYILEGIKSHELYSHIEFWKNLIIRKIEEEFKVIRVNFTDKIPKGKKEDIINSKLIIFSQIMKEFDFSKDKIVELSIEIFDKYQFNEESRKTVLGFIISQN